MKPFALLVVSLFCSFPLFCQRGAPFVLVNKQKQATIVLSKNEAAGVHLAAVDLVADIQKITNKRLRIQEHPKAKSNHVYIQTRPDSSKREVYQIKVKNGDLYITGSDELGTIFGIYHFAEHYLRVDPMYFWNDREPESKAVLAWKSIAVQSKKTTFRYRGWFINDEDLLTEWYESTGKRQIDYPFYQQVLAPEIIKKVCETALRMRFNLIIPASFVDIRNPAEAELVEIASKRGLFVSMHHVEPMGVSAFTFFNYWKEKTGEKPMFSYFSNREKVEEVWRVYAQEWAKYPKVIWQIGLRGIGDRPMWLADPNTPQTDADRGKLISEAMSFQMDLIRSVDKRPSPPVTTTLWAEGSTLNQAGHLNIPEKVIIVFADNSPGWRWQADFFQTKRLPYNDYGVYYHHQLWGSGPHLVPIVEPAKTQKVISQAVEKGDTTYCIMNVSNIREFALGIAASAQMLQDFKYFNLEKFNQQWFGNHYGTQAKAVQELYQTYFDAFVVSDQTGTPILMDGQTNGLAAGILRELKLQINNPSAYQAALQKKNQETEESKWIKSSIGDMLSGNLSNSALLQKVQQQKRSFLKADSLAQIVLPALSLKQQAFFQTDFLASLKIILGLQIWLENTLLAKIAADEHRLTEVLVPLQAALEAFTLIKAGQGLKTKGTKWQHWYRGDKKMNLLQKEALVLETLKLLN
ncbi:MAG TPA: glycosyl hydrolase 115 family protein [Haliscomenobacter sp.]|uniref:glycosyl hydrolase 115 family protein n=1 Tax=Haliscomenobacter sp. TaxID=2717303 RepID=UPI002B8AD623|nr:glycosyl hydrolase 115 family protein [Haliscomenobacter sp.]HOY21220.1 glycosyl hydrolase 115 family protein [Haliscomenobacter sp.]